MKNLIRLVISNVLLIAAVMGLTMGTANAQLLPNLNTTVDTGIVDATISSEYKSSARGCELINCIPGKQYYANPSSCDSFCQCSNGVPYYQPCPAGLEFNPTLNVCDYPQNAGCKL